MWVFVSGIPGELYYVRSGIINDYALSFNLPIRSDVDVIYFDWQNLRKSPPDSTVSLPNSFIPDSHTINMHLRSHNWATDAKSPSPPIFGLGPVVGFYPKLRDSYVGWLGWIDEQNCADYNSFWPLYSKSQLEVLKMCVP